MANDRKKTRIKNALHPQNKHLDGYDFESLITYCPALEAHLVTNPYNNRTTIPFANPEAVLLLNQALLQKHYHINDWQLPEGYLCPPIPGRADYLYYISELLAEDNAQRRYTVPKGENITCLDVGTGANLVYPLLGNALFGWSFTASDIDSVALDNAASIIEKNEHLKGKITLRKQENDHSIFKGIIEENERFDMVICNPPFHSSAEEARASNRRKVNNLNPNKNVKAVRNFGGQSNELFCEGGELQFIKNMIAESPNHATNCFWFTTLVSKQGHLNQLQEALHQTNPTQVEVIDMGQGNKRSRILCWSYLNDKQRASWMASRWR